MDNIFDLPNFMKYKNTYFSIKGFAYELALLGNKIPRSYCDIYVFCKENIFNPLSISKLEADISNYFNNLPPLGKNDIIIGSSSREKHDYNNLFVITQAVCDKDVMYGPLKDVESQQEVFRLRFYFKDFINVGRKRK